MNKIKRIAILFLVSFILSHSMCANASSTDSSDKPTRVRIGLAARSTTSMPFFVARERGLFREEGLEAELIVMQAIQTIQAMIGKSTEFASATGTAVSSAVSGAEVKVILAVTDRPSFDLIVQPDITSVQQLRGKKIGTGGVGSLTEILSRRVLTAHGVRPEEVALLTMGTSQLTFLALKAKTIDATMLQMPLTFTAQDEGYRKLVDAGTVYRSVQGGLATTKSVLSQRPDLATRVVRATLRAIRLIKTDRNYSIDFIKGPWLDIGRDRERIAARVYEAAAPGLLESGSVNEDIQRQMIADAALRIKPSQPVLPEQVFDFSIVRKVGETLK